MRFEQYINEVSTAGATQMEMAIVQKWNGDKLTTPKFEESAGNIVKFLKKNGYVSGRALHMGSGSFPLNKIWKKYGGTDSTPKTDLKIGRARISLKKNGGSQLMSGKKGESHATFFSVVNKYNTRIGDPVVDKVEEYFNQFIENGKNRMNITQQKETGNISKNVLKAEKMHKEFTKYLKELFDTNTILRNSFIHEAMSGKIKFDNGDGTSDHMLIFDPEGIDNMWHKIDMPYASRVAERTKINVSWKSVSSTTKKQGKIYNYYSVIRLLNGKVKSESSLYDGQILTEGIITNIWDKVWEWFRGLWIKIKRWLKQSIDNLFEFFEIEPQLDIGESIL